MNTILFSTLIASVLVTGNTFQMNDTIDRYVVDGYVFDGFNGAEIVGRNIVSYKYNYLTSISAGQSPTVIREHEINTKSSYHQGQEMANALYSTIDGKRVITSIQYYITDYQDKYSSGQELWEALNDAWSDENKSARERLPRGRTSHSMGTYSDTPDVDSCLIIIDGKRTHNGLSSISSDDIESVEVVKGSESEKRYGKDGRNGAIIITTKGNTPSLTDKFIVNGKELTKEEFSKMKINDVESVTIVRKTANLKDYFRFGSKKPTEEEYQIEIKNDAQSKLLWSGSIKAYSIHEDGKKENINENNTAVSTPDGNNKYELEVNPDKGLFVHQSFHQNSRQFVETDIELDKCLVIIDGKESKNGLKSVDKNNIGKVSVLKDTQATDRYGAKGRNGVVIITSPGKTAPDFNSFIADGKEVSAQEYSKMDRNKIDMLTIISKEYDLTDYFNTGANVIMVNETVTTTSGEYRKNTGIGW